MPATISILILVPFGLPLDLGVLALDTIVEGVYWIDKGKTFKLSCSSMVSLLSRRE